MIENMPKVELHVHLDGSMSPDIAASVLTLDKTETLKQMSILGKCHDLNEYLEKFNVPIQALQSKETLKNTASQLARDLKKDHVVYAEVRFAPMQHVNKKCTKEQVVKSVLEGFESVDGIVIRTILCMMRNAPYEENVSVIELAEQFKNDGVVAIDLAGAEALYETETFKNLFSLASSKHIPFTIHAGEADGPSSIASAVAFGAKRIGHGVRIIEDEKLLEIAKNKHIVFEICPTSNIQTGVVQSYSKHPIKTLYEKGCIVTINTDNRTVSATTLTKEYQHLQDAFGFTVQDFIHMNEDAIASAFADTKTKEKIKQMIHNFEVTLQTNKDE